MNPPYRTATLPDIDGSATFAPVTAKAFIASDQNEGGLAEWLDGKVIVHDVPKEAHQRIAGLLFFLLLAYVGRRRLGA